MFPDAPQHPLGLTFGVVDHRQGEDEDSDSGSPPRAGVSIAYPEEKFAPANGSLPATLASTAQTQDVVVAGRYGAAQEAMQPSVAAAVTTSREPMPSSQPVIVAQ